MLSMLVSIGVGNNKKSSYALAFMSLVKAFNTYSKYKSSCKLHYKPMSIFHFR